MQSQKNEKLSKNRFGILINRFIFAPSFRETY